MFHVEPVDLWLRIAAASRFPVPDDLAEDLTRYRDWLVSEAIPAGGIGPGEASRVDIRHIADSLLFSLAIEPGNDEVLDVGTGVGLPGIPLACLMPETRFFLLDRSARRVRLANRAVRVLQLVNVEVIQSDLHRWRRAAPVVVSRATIPPEELLSPLRTLVSPGGIAVLGGSWNERPEVDGYDVKEIGSAFLDRSVWILMMRQT